MMTDAFPADQMPAQEGSLAFRAALNAVLISAHDADQHGLDPDWTLSDALYDAARKCRWTPQAAFDDVEEIQVAEGWLMDAARRALISSEGEAGFELELAYAAARATVALRHTVGLLAEYCKLAPRRRTVGDCGDID